MNKVIIGCFFISSLLVIEAEANYLPIYDASGTWIVSESNGWTDCSGDTVKPESETITINQTGRIFTIHTDDGIYTGSVSGSTYLLIRSYQQQGSAGKPGIETAKITVTLTSETKGNGRYLGSWSANDGSVTCSWGTTLDISKRTGTGSNNR